MSLETTGIPDVGMPDIRPKGENGVTVGRRIVVGENNTHFMEITELWLSRNGFTDNPHDGFATVPYLILRWQSHRVFPTDDIRKRRLTWIRTGNLTLATERVQFLPLLPKPGISARQLFLVEIVYRVVYHNVIQQ